MIPLLLAAPDLPEEPLLVKGAPAEGLHVVRRCLDAAELLAAAAAEPDAEIVLSPGLPRLTTGLLEQVRRGRVVIGVVRTIDDQARLATLDVPSVVCEHADAHRTLASIARLVLEARADVRGPRAPAREPDLGPGEAVADEAAGRVVAVWGPQGAPGRTTVALGIADALARRGHRTCLVDADTFAPSMALGLGVVDDRGGLAAACRLADLGTLDERTLSPFLVPLRADLVLLAGLSGSDRWSDLRRGALDQVLSALRTLADVIVVDAGFCVDTVEDTAWSRPRNVAERAVLGSADDVVAVADASAAGAARLVQDWPAVTAMAAVTPLVVRNRSRGRRLSTQPSHRVWVHGVRALGVQAPVVDLPADPATVDRAWRRGRALGDVAPRSRLCHALERLALEVVSG